MRAAENSLELNPFNQDIAFLTSYLAIDLLYVRIGPFSGSAPLVQMSGLLKGADSASSEELSEGQNVNSQQSPH